MKVSTNNKQHGYSANALVKRAIKADFRPGTALYQLVQTAGQDSTELALINILKQHQYSTGWIVLVAPQQLPDKFLAESYQLPVDRILVIHPTIKLTAADCVQQALKADTTSVVICFSSEPQPQLTQLAEQTQTTLYQLQPAAGNLTH
ncbi:SulA-like leucine-rich domain-containing protein [Arsukibacterium sp.]|uniref:SulA-like leucine-rich domain-containing protein n=1 Tax=Arsukibacterium sp. TaxID=1977258 RepID=UPI002FDB8E9D